MSGPLPQNFAPAATKAVQKLERVRVLVVDSSTQAAELMKNIFVQLGFTNIMVANDISQSIQIMRYVRVDMIFADWALKIGNTLKSRSGADPANPFAVSGARFIKNLRFSPASPNPFVPVVMLMDTVTNKEIFNVRDSGVNELIIKPLEAAEFCRKIVSVIDHPRMFITASTYKGPCRRIRLAADFKGEDRRKAQIRLIRRGEFVPKTRSFS